MSEHPHIRSYHARAGRMGPELTSEWAEHAAGFAMPEGRWELPAGSILEVGTGMGDAVLATARHFPDSLVIGVDVHLRGLAATVRSARAESLSNLRLVYGDVMPVLAEQVPPASLGEIHVWFPDPWPKARHHKRRLIRPAVAGLFADRLAPGGTLRLATDWADYATAMVEVLDAEPGLRRVAGNRPDWRPVTRYEAAAGKAGRLVADLAYQRAGAEQG